MQKTWKLTDADNFQYGKKLSDNIYRFREFDRNIYNIDTDDYSEKIKFIDSVFYNPEYWVQYTIDINDYSDEEISKYINGYYSSIDEVKNIYGGDYKWIIAECIFEQESELY